MAFSYIWVIVLRSHWTLPHVCPVLPAKRPPSFSQRVLPSIFMLHRLHFALSFPYLTVSHSFSLFLVHWHTCMHTHIHTHSYVYMYALNISENTMSLFLNFILFNIILSYINFHENLIILLFFMPEKVSLCIYYPSIIWWMFRLIPLPSDCEERKNNADVQVFVWWDMKSFGCEGCGFDM